MTLPFRPDPPDKREQQRAYLIRALADAFRPDATRTAPPNVPAPRPRPTMRAVPAGPSALPLPNATARSQERGRDRGSEFIMGLTDASGTVLDAAESVKAAREGRFRNALGHALLAATPVVSGTSVRAGADKLADALRGLTEGPLAGTRVVDESGMPKRVYHGTSAAFDTFDMDRLDPNGLYGPGLYWTENPAVAGGEGVVGGYAAKAGDGLRTATDTDLRARAAAERAQAARFRDDAASATDPEARAFWQHVADVRDQEAARLLSEIAKPMQAPNVRPARLAVRSPYDVDREYSRDEAAALFRSVLDGLPEEKRRRFPQGPDWDRWHTHLASNLPDRIGGEDLYRKAVSWIGAGDMATVNTALKNSGYDGITHIGGANTGTDPHRVWIAFDRSQVRSAFDDPRTARQVGAALLTTGAGTAALRAQQEKKQKP